MEKGSDRGQAGVACPDRVLPLRFKLIQKGEHKVSIEVLDRQCAWLTPRAPGGEENQQTQGVAVTADGRVACVPLSGQPVAEERLQKRRQRTRRAHEASPPVNARSAAVPSRSAVPVT